MAGPVKVTQSFINDENGVRPWPSSCLLVITLQAHSDVSQAPQGQASLGGLTKEWGPKNFSSVHSGSSLICDIPEGPPPTLPNTSILSTAPQVLPPCEPQALYSPRADMPFPDSWKWVPACLSKGQCPPLTGVSCAGVWEGYSKLTHTKHLDWTTCQGPRAQIVPTTFSRHFL